MLFDANYSLLHDCVEPFIYPPAQFFSASYEHKRTKMTHIVLFTPFVQVGRAKTKARSTINGTEKQVVKYICMHFIQKN